jgi:hypothetical protein
VWRQREPHRDASSFAVARPDQGRVAQQIDQLDASAGVLAGQRIPAREYPYAMVADDDYEGVVLDVGVELEPRLVVLSIRVESAVRAGLCCGQADAVAQVACDPKLVAHLRDRVTCAPNLVGARADVQ